MTIQTVEANLWTLSSTLGRVCLKVRKIVLVRGGVGVCSCATLHAAV